MKPFGKYRIKFLSVVVAVAAVAVFGWQWTTRFSPKTAGRLGAGPGSVTIDYPADGSIFPPDMTPPMFSWHDTSQAATVWRLDVAFADGAAEIHAESPGPPPQIGEIDPRCVAVTNEAPKLSPHEAAAHTWRPDEKTWAAIRTHAVGRQAAVAITGFAAADQPVSHGRVNIQVSKDPVGAPIFYRDVPLMPGKMAKGIIRPLAETALPLIAWRLRSVGLPRSRLLLQDMPTCANCHSFSGDGRTLGMDLDGPDNDKAIYAIASVAPETSIRNRDVIRWDSFQYAPEEKRRGTGLRIGFMSQVSPDGNYVVSTLKSQEYVANFVDYRYLQVFYPTRGILACYSKATGGIQPLPGADDPRYVQAGSTWSPDGKYLVFSRAEAKEAYPEGRKMATFANDPNETPIQYDLCRIPFNAGKGGRAEPIAGASQNGMSNSFPKVSPDGRWIVFVQCRNGFLMRPDSQLYIIPAEGGKSRRMQCNTPRMNSWHSFSPNGRWLVFSSKSRGPYTQMFLTHLDTEGNDSPAILIENATAANRAVNIPEFVNMAADGLLKIDVPAAEAYRHCNLGTAEMEKDGRSKKALAEFRKALEIDPELSRAQNNLGALLAADGQVDEAIAHYRKALKIKPDYVEAHCNLGTALAGRGQFDEAIDHFRKTLEINPDQAVAHDSLGLILAGRGQADEAMAHYSKALEINPEYAKAHYNLGNTLAGRGQFDEAIAHFRKAVEIKPDFGEAHNNLGTVLARQGWLDEAIAHFRKAVEIKPDHVKAHCNLGTALANRGQFDEAIAHFRKALEIKPDYVEAHCDLGRVLAARGRLDEAIQQLQKALDLASAQNNKPLADAIRAGIKQLQSNGH